MKCSNCGANLTPEEKLINAIFGSSKLLCEKCSAVSFTPKCRVCGEPTHLTLNGTPLCKEHIGKWR